MMRHRRWRWVRWVMHPFQLAALAAVALAFHGSQARAEPAVQFDRDVKPILAENCFQCHGPDETTRKGKLRLDTRDDALRGGKSGKAAIAPGKAGESALIDRLVTTNADKRMPPAETKKTLTSAQIDTLKRWIDGGADYRKHWSFDPPRRPAVPSVQAADWPANDIDRFVLAKLEKSSLHPSPQADRRTLLRRLSLDLIGLPPTPAEMADFLADASPEAYERQVDRLLASPRFGEKWARQWLDAARYADSDGYEKDVPRKQWLWRDWVINAYNRDLPYNQFIIEQIAGDLLPNATQDQRVATGFLRNGMVNEEGAIVAEQFRMEGLIDRLDCIGKSVLGLTIQCAQCHSHKFDPLSQEEYYRLMAFLNNDYEATTWVYTPQQLERIKTIERSVADREAKMRADDPEWPQKLAEWEERAKQGEIEWKTLSSTEQEWVGGLAHPQKQPDDSILTLGFRPSDGDLYVVADTPVTHITGLRLEALTHGDLPFNGPGRSKKGTFAVSEVIVESMPAADAKKKDAKYEKVTFAGASADFAQADQLIDPDFRRDDKDKRRVGPADYLIDGKEDTAWGTDRGPGRRHQDSTAVLRFAKPIDAPEGTRLKVTLRFKHAGKDIHGRDNNFLGRFRLSVTSAADPAADPLPKPVRQALHMPPEHRTAEQQAAVFSTWRRLSPDFKAVNDEIENVWKDFPEGETVLNLARRAPQDERKTFILDRGDWQKPSRVITPGVPAVLNPLPENSPPSRLTLARWLVDRRSPTAARVAVNRMWQAVFGTGIVETVEDFGVRAAEPTHPELLDWLAVEFMDHGWSTKQLLRTIVLSSTYRQSVRMTPESLERDPRNQMLARGPRFRADAEVVRDVALSAAGLLNDRIGGPSFFPPVPQSLFAQSYLAVDFWKTADAPERYRRSLYVFRRRSMPDPMLACFDAPNGDTACARRVRSNTPLAALAAMNEPVFVEASRALALRILREGGESDDGRAAYGFSLCTGRTPKAQEAAAVLSLLNSQRKRVAEGWMSPRALTTGDAAALPALPPGATPTDAAAWTIVSRVLLNLDETVTKN